MTDFAKLMGVDHAAVSRAIAAGRLPRSVELQENGRHLIDVAVAKVEWEENRLRGARNGRQDDEPEPTGLGPDGRPRQSLIESERQKAQYQVDLLRLKFEEESGRLIDATAIKSSALRTARLVRDSLLAIPDRVSSELAAEKDPFEVRRRLDEEIRAALQNLASELTAADPEETPEPEPDPEPEAVASA